MPKKSITLTDCMEPITDPTRFATMYNCSKVDVDSVPLAARKQVAAGICMIIVFAVYEVSAFCMLTEKKELFSGSFYDLLSVWDAFVVCVLPVTIP